MISDPNSFNFLLFPAKFLYIPLSIFQVSHNVKAGDEVNFTISELQPLKAEPEDIPLDIVYEDKHLLVVNKPAHMVITFFLSTMIMTLENVSGKIKNISPYV